MCDVHSTERAVRTSSRGFGIGVGDLGGQVHSVWTRFLHGSHVARGGAHRKDRACHQGGGLAEGAESRAHFGGEHVYVDGIEVDNNCDGDSGNESDR
jgi:hypothetical protein